MQTGFTRVPVLALSLFALLSFTQLDTARAATRQLTIGGSPVTSVRTSSAYAFTPRTSGTPGRRMTFSVRNKPSWATFSPYNGSIKGTPRPGDAGTFNNIVVSVTDGKYRATLPAFSIRVFAPARPMPSTQRVNRAPAIRGTPVKEITAGQAFNFAPSATDADGDKLAFSIDSKPSWATFDPVTGRLWGVPTSAQTGSYEEIQISVSDGKATTRLPIFAINVMEAALQARSVSLSWTAPTQNTDGSALTDLAGYRIVYGPKSGEHTQSVRVTNPGLTTFAVDDLEAGQYFFAIIAVNSKGAESGKSQEINVDLT